MTVAKSAATAAPGPLRILLVDDDGSDNNNIPGDSRRSLSDTVFSRLASEAVGGDKNAWAVETVKSYGNGPGIDRLRPYSLILWYTGASYGGNPDNTAVLSIEDEKTVRRYLEEVAGTVLLVSPGYISKVLEQGSTWEQTTWPFVKEVLGLRGGVGLAQRFEPGTVTTSQGTKFQVNKGGAVETQFSAVNPNGATVVFNSAFDAAKGVGKSAPVATTVAYGKGRIIYVGFSLENLAEAELTPAFQHLLAAGGLPSKAVSTTAAAPATPTANCAPASTELKTTSRAQAPAADTGPASVRVSGTPTTAVVSWTLPTAMISNASLSTAPTTTTRAAKTSAPQTTPQTITAKVERLVANAAPVVLNVTPPDAQQVTDAGPLSPGQAVTYRVTLSDACNVLGAKEAVFTPPAVRDPSGLSATVAADGAVTLSWQEVPGVTTYQITGTTLTAPVLVRNATEWRSTPQTPGLQSWKVASQYEPGGVITAASAWPSVRTRRVPTPAMPFLLLPNGVGSPAESAAMYAQQCQSSANTSSSANAQCPDADWFLSLSTDWVATWGSKYGGGPVPPAWPIAAFADLNDLGLGRRVNCTLLAAPPNPIVMCWATSHGQIPVAGQTPDGAALAAKAEQVVDIKAMNLIIMSAQGAFFGTWEPMRAVTTRVSTASEKEDAFVETSDKVYQTPLDSQGPKTVPHVCLSCHGGRYDAARKIVTGASLLPLIPSHLTFSSPQARANSEEQIRRINYIILDSNPAPAIRAQINTLYNGTPGTPGTRANDNAVPAGWASQAGLYRQVIAPYCGTCHFSQTGPLSFDSYTNLVNNKARVQRAVCQTFNMPHSEQGLRKFWTEGGNVLLPGLLSTALGYPKCPE